MDTQPAPKHLSKESKKWWKHITEGWELDYDALFLLQAALESYDRVQQARDIITKEGLVITSGRSGVKHMHPALTIEKEARAQLVRSWVAIGLGIEPPGDKGRPPQR